MTVNMNFILDLGTDDDPTDLDSSSGANYLSSYVAKGLPDNPDLPEDFRLVSMQDIFTWVPRSPTGYRHITEHPIRTRPNNQIAITWEYRRYLLTGANARQEVELNLPVTSELEIRLFAHLHVRTDLSEEIIQALTAALQNYSQNETDDLQKYIVNLVETSDVFPADFSHETYLVDIGYTLKKISEEINEDEYTRLKTFIPD